MTVLFNVYVQRSGIPEDDGRLHHVEWNAPHLPDSDVCERWQREYGRLIYSGQHSPKQVEAARLALVPVLNGIEEGERYEDRTIVHLVKAALGVK